jgi:hypothetical protein
VRAKHIRIEEVVSEIGGKAAKPVAREGGCRRLSNKTSLRPPCRLQFSRPAGGPAATTIERSTIQGEFVDFFVDYFFATEHTEIAERMVGDVEGNGAGEAGLES